jgi:phospholipase/carboxylesterase
VCGFSGFVPVVDGWEADLSSPPPVAYGHGVYDPVIPVEFGRRVRETLEPAGGELLYREYPLDHTLDPGFLVEVRDWLAKKVSDT